MMIKILKFVSRRIVFLYLDILSIPSKFMGKEGNAAYHRKYVCVRCPNYRRKYRDVDGKGVCWWTENWAKGNYDIPKHFGVSNWIRSYLGLKMKLDKYKKQ